MADLERGLALSPESVFDIASNGKQFTAMVILILARQGLLSMDDDIRRWLPELPDYGETITIRHLIHHASGLRDYTTLMELEGMPFENAYTEEELLQLIVRQKALNFRPGDEHLYSNTGYFLLGILAQRAAGKTLLELIREHILEPLDPVTPKLFVNPDVDLEFEHNQQGAVSGFRLGTDRVRNIHFTRCSHPDNQNGDIRAGGAA